MPPRRLIAWRTLARTMSGPRISIDAKSGGETGFPLMATNTGASTSLIFLFEFRHVLVCVKKMAFFIEKFIFAIAIPAEFQSHVVEFLPAMDRPDYAILAIGCVDKVAFGVSATGFGTACMLHGRVDSDDGRRCKVVNGA